MIDENRKRLAKSNFDIYLQDELIKKAKNPIAKQMYQKNAELSLNTAAELMKSELKPNLWIIVVSYYSMFYAANSVLLHLGYKVGDKIVHKVTNESLIVLVLHRLSKKLLENYENARNDAMEIASFKAEAIIEGYGYELDKRSKFQYEMLEETKANKAKTSFERAKEFLFEMKKLMK